MKSDFKNENAMTRWSQACCAQSATVELVRGLRVSLWEGECHDEVCAFISLGCSKQVCLGTHSARCYVKQTLPGPHPLPCLTWSPSSQCSWLQDWCRGKVWGYCAADSALRLVDRCDIFQTQVTHVHSRSSCKRHLGLTFICALAVKMRQNVCLELFWTCRLTYLLPFFLISLYIAHSLQMNTSLK